MPSRLIATAFALACFAGAIVVGLYASNTASTILTRAIIVMLVAWPIGSVIGHFCERVINQSVQEYKKGHPIPDDKSAYAEASRQLNVNDVGDDSVNVDIVDDDETNTRSVPRQEAA